MITKEKRGGLFTKLFNKKENSGKERKGKKRMKGKTKRRKR